jgi:hypothetical protein
VERIYGKKVHTRRKGHFDEEGGHGKSRGFGLLGQDYDPESGLFNLTDRPGLNEEEEEVF